MKKLLIIPLVFTILISISSCAYYADWTNAEEVSTEGNTTTARINLEIEDVKTRDANKVIVESTLVNGMGLPVYTRTEELEILKDNDGYYVNHDFEYFGKFRVILTYTSDGAATSYQNFEYNLTADEYNIALLSATVPVTYFSLFMADEDNGYAEELQLPINSDLPTIIGLERSAAFNWDSCLPNIVKCPFIGKDNYGRNLAGNEYTEAIETFAQYIGYLHKLNPESKFHLYLNDFDSYYVPHMMLENGINFDQFDVFAISDGTGTPAIFRSRYGTGEEPDESLSVYSSIEGTWKTVKEKALNGRNYIADLMSQSGLVSHLNRYMKDFMPVLVNDPELNIKWIMNRNNPDAFGTSAAYTEKVQKNENIYVVNMYNILQALSDEEVEAFKKMYKFDSSIFEEADKANKGIMIFLGTSTSYEVYFEDYLTFMTNYYGDEYIYYYKAHPGYAADFDSDKAALLDKLGIISLDASIPAELFYFFRDDAVMCGYESSTFENAAGVEISCIVNTDTETYSGRADLTITANEDGTFTVSNIKDYPGTFIWYSEKPDVFPWLVQE